MPIFACRRRCSRSMLVGPTPGSIVAMSRGADQRAARRVERRAGDRLEVVAELRRQPHADVVLLVAVAQLGRHDAFDHAAQLHGDAADVEAEVGGQLAVDARHHFRLAALERAVDVHRARHLPDLRDDLVAEPLQRRPCRRRARRR